ncbi:hypothetical protein HWA77_16975 [Photobacterium damselae subsp. damselae]|uniref:Uncharacterized protein n=1 Tax=Photobacterium damselae subsp. damselae TaxID=85581 RepID=A0A850QZ88_PHODD|nr:hypothetical protein [Photobacterium damselae subsp. damselae]
MSHEYTWYKKSSDGYLEPLYIHSKFFYSLQTYLENIWSERGNISKFQVGDGILVDTKTFEHIKAYFAKTNIENFHHEESLDINQALIVVHQHLINGDIIYLTFS